MSIEPYIAIFENEIHDGIEGYGPKFFKRPFPLHYQSSGKIMYGLVTICFVSYSGIEHQTDIFGDPQ